MQTVAYRTALLAVCPDASRDAANVQHGAWHCSGCSKLRCFALLVSGCLSGGLALLFFCATGQPAELDSFSLTTSLAQETHYGRGGVMLALQVFFLILSLCLFAIAANHWFAQANALQACLPATIGAIMFVFGTLSVRKLFKFHKDFQTAYGDSGYSGDPEANHLFKDCGCVVYIGDLVLLPVLYNVISVFISYLMNFSITYFINRAIRRHRDQIGTLILESMAMPSRISVVCFVIPSFLTQVYHFYQLVGMGRKVDGIMALVATYMAWMNSGQVTFITIATLGQFLADDAGTRLAKRRDQLEDIEETAEGSVKALVDDAIEELEAEEAEQEANQTNLEKMGIWSSEALIRWTLALLLLVLSLPAVPCVFLGHIGWFWVSLPVEMLLALLLMLFFPDRVADSMSILRHDDEEEDMPLLYKVMIYIMFPLLRPLAYLVPDYWMSPDDETAKKPNLWPSLEVLLISVITLIKVTLWQFTFDFFVSWAFLGIDYWSVVLFNFESRHYFCNPCLVSKRLEMQSQQMEDLRKELWLTLISYF